MSLRMDKPCTKTSNLVLFHAVLHLITACTGVVAREINYARLGYGRFSRADRDKLKRIADGLAVIGLVARIIGHASRVQEQRPIRGGRSVNIGSRTVKDLSIIKGEEHAITHKPDGGTLV